MKHVIVFVMMVFFSGPALADKQRIGDWILDVDSEYAEAFTSNDSGSVFGFLCIGDSCTAYIDAQIKCDDDSKTAILVNSDAGATYLVTRCIHFPTESNVRYLNSFQDKDIVDAISKGSAIGFAIPLESGEFRVLRFSLDGAAAAVVRAVDAAKINAQPNKGNNLFRDSTM